MFTNTNSCYKIKLTVVSLNTASQKDIGIQGDIMSEKISKDEIVNAVLKTTFYKSAGATSLNDIASELGIKKASLYNHFASREEIFDYTSDACSEYMNEISFKPGDIEAVTNKYTPVIVLKGMVNRYFKMHEKAPLFQIYTFVESTKYFSSKSAEIVKAEKAKLISQTEEILTALVNAGKISITAMDVKSAATWFCSAIRDFLSQYLLERKQLVINNPADGEGELFSLPSDEKAFAVVDYYIEQFVNAIK